jgi:hypothetical protein
MIMSFKPFNWNVVIAGAWNRAIFTPEWVKANVFKLEDKDAINVEVPLNVLAPYRVRHEDIGITVGNGTLIVDAISGQYPVLDKARECAGRIICELPKTPLTAIGFNVRYQCNELPPELIEISKCKIDDIFSENGFEIVGRQLRRSLKHEEGLINFELLFDDKEGAILFFNFHIGSSDVNMLKNWLTIPINDVQAKVDKIINNLPGVTIV